MDMESIEDQKLKFGFKNSNYCTNKLPKVGQLVNLNQYECYFAVRKKQKPVVRVDNCIGVTKKDKSDLKSDISESLPAHNHTARENSRGSILEEESKDQGGSTNHSSGSENSNKGKTKFGFALLNKYKNKLQPFFKNKKEMETSMVPKCRNRYIAFDQGRLLMIKRLYDTVDGDKVTEMRRYPGFKQTMSTNPDQRYDLPLVVWNAKIVRVYKLDLVKSLRIRNFEVLQQICLQDKETRGFAVEENERMSFANISKVVPNHVAEVSLQWLRLGGSQMVKQFRPGQNMDEYLSLIRFQYTSSSLSSLGFDALSEIDNTYEMLVRDFQDFFLELESERIKAMGIKVPVKVSCN